MRCLCGAKSCRGYIGGTGEAVTAEEDMEDPEDASEDPEPIMINGAEAADPKLVAVLESEVGLAPEYWDSAVWHRCGALPAREECVSLLVACAVPAALQQESILPSVQA